MKSLWVTFAILFFSTGFCFGYGSPDYNPDGSHPRIFLTTSVLAEYNTLQNSSDQKWTDLENWCDAHLGDTGYDGGDPEWDAQGSSNGYRMSGYRDFLMRFALGYQILKDDNATKADTYATYVRNIIIDGIAGSFSAGDEANGIIALRGGESGGDTTINIDEATALGISSSYTYKLGYPNRNLASVALAFDWIYDTLSSSDKATIVDMLLRWFDWTRGVRSTYNNGVLIGTTRYYEDTDGDCTGDNNCTAAGETAQKGYAYDSMGNNFFAGHAYNMIVTAVATYGENTTANADFDYVQDTFLPNMKTVYSSDLRLSGGDSSEGVSYFGGYEFSLRGLYAYYTATGEDIFDGFDWPLDLIKCNINKVYPDLDSVPIWGDVNSVGLGTNLAYIMAPLYGVNLQVNSSETETGVMKWLLDNHGTSRPAGIQEQLLWNYKSPTATVQSPLSAGLTPFYHAKGTGLVTMRSSWDVANNTVFGAIRIEDKREAAHENHDAGGFYVARGEDGLIDRVTYVDSSNQSSTIRFDGTEFLSPSSDALDSTAISRVVNSTDYTYLRGEIKHSLYSEWHEDIANLFVRSFLFIRPNIFVIYDVTESNPNRTNKKEWYTQYNTEPSVSGNIVSVVVGDSKSYTETLYPTGGTYTVTNDDGGYSYDRWQAIYMVDANEYDQFLHVIEATGSTESQTATSLVTGSYVRGALIGTTVAMFTSNQEGGDVQSATYTVDATTHYIADLPVNSLIDVTRAGMTIVTDQDSGDAGIIEFSAASGSAEYVVTAGDYVPPIATCSDGIQNGDETGIDCGGSCDSCSGGDEEDGSLVPPTLHIDLNK